MVLSIGSRVRLPRLNRKVLSGVEVQVGLASGDDISPGEKVRVGKQRRRAVHDSDSDQIPCYSVPPYKPSR